MQLPAKLLETLSAGADAADCHCDWPTASWDALRSAGVLAWSIPREHGGLGLKPVELLEGSEALGKACLTTAFILSQRDAAIRRLRKGPQHLREQYLPPLARSEIFMTVGLSQLTTSRRNPSAGLQAVSMGDGGFRLRGAMPWVTGADAADAIVAGATLADGSQLVAVMPTNRAGVTIDQPMSLAALNGSRTCAIHCHDVEISKDEILAGPANGLSGLGGGGLETSCLALAVAAAATEIIARERLHRPALAEPEAAVQSSLTAARRRMHELASSPVVDSDPALALRVDCTRLVLSATQIALVAAKGSGFVRPHVAERIARQALFFLVWSVPKPVGDGLLERISPSR